MREAEGEGTKYLLKSGNVDDVAGPGGTDTDARVGDRRPAYAMQQGAQSWKGVNDIVNVLLEPMQPTPKCGLCSPLCSWLPRAHVAL